ncbi:hypothetical protein BURPS1710A_A2663 [Burkholderia pseudomallei 1710a]|uniref:Uncharacterized protein n=1 Tax=Burkholderia pseudomallei 1710a TaxID=320371 RepID=A0A0E1VYC2_BURPE|nr:hypothetical protein BURPS1710A_A2663 [Burkholderia pseudomallei 1710a]
MIETVRPSGGCRIMPLRAHAFAHVSRRRMHDAPDRASARASNDASSDSALPARTAGPASRSPASRQAVRGGMPDDRGFRGRRNGPASW